MFGITISDFISRLIALLIALTFHEFAHGYAAYLLGDKTAKLDGRLSFNPINHVDPIGLLCMLFFRFGWAKPVQVDPRAFKNPKKGMALTALAGPVTNLFLAFISILIYYPFMKSSGFLSSTLLMCFSMNIGLGVFNLLPIPPLDGSKVLGIFLPNKYYYKMMQYDQIGMIVLLLLVYTGVFGFILSPLINNVAILFISIAQLIYG